MPTVDHVDKLDFLAVEAYSWSPNLETACEICLCEAAAGRRVGFAFLNVLNVDEYYLWRKRAPLVARLLKSYRFIKVKAIASILRSHGVRVFLLDERHVAHLRLTCEQAGLDSAAELRAFQLNGANVGLGVLSSLITHCQNIDPDLVENRHLADLLLTSAYRCHQLTTELLNSCNPSTILVFNGRFACAKAIVGAARQNNIDVLFHEVGATIDRYYLSSGAVHSASNARKLLQQEWNTAGPEREAIAQRYFAPRRKGLGLTEGRHDNGQKRNKMIPRTGRWRLVYYASSVDEFAAVEDAKDQYLFATQREAVQWLVHWVRARPETELVIRVHPRMTNLSVQERNWWMSFSGGNVMTIPAEHPCDSYALAESADRIVTYHSSLGPESTYLGKVSILVGDAKYRGLDCVYEPMTEAELEHILLDKTLTSKPAQNCLPFGYNRMMGGTLYKFYKARTYSNGSFFGKAYPPLPSRLEARVRKSITVIKGFVGRFRSKREVVYWQ